MSVLDSFLSSMGPGVVQQITQQFGIDGTQATSVLSTVIPMLAGGLKNKVSSEGGAGLMDMITGSSFQQFADNPATLNSSAAIEQGKSLLSQIFGGSEGLSEVTNKTAEKTGLGGSIISSMLPIVASLFMGYISKNSAGNSASALDMLGGFADTGGIVDTLKGLASKVFG